ARGDDRDAATRSVRLAFDQVDIVRDVEVALRMLTGSARPRDRLFVFLHRLRLGLRLRLRLRLRLLDVLVVRLIRFRRCLVLELERFRLFAWPALAHSSASYLRSWWWSLCPSLSRFFAR